MSFLDRLGNSTPIDNKKFTPEYNNGQVNDNQKGTQNMTNAQGNATQMDIDNSNNNNGQLSNAVADDDDAQGQATQTQKYTVAGVEYDNVEDLISAFEERDESYKNLQRDYTKKSQALSLMRKQNESPINMNYGPQPYAQQPYAQQPYGYPNYSGQPYPQQPYGYPNYGQQPVGIGLNNINQIQNNQASIQRQRQMMQQVNNQVAMNQAMIQMSADNAVNELKQSDADFDNVAPTLWELIDTDPYFSNVQFTSPEMVKQTIGIAYNMAKQKVEQAKMNIKINNARKDAYKNKQDKLINNDNSQGVNNQGQRQQQKATPQDSIKSSIVSVKPVRF